MKTRKNKILRVLALTAALVIIGGLLYFSNQMVGNPVSKMLCKRSAERYMEEQYGDTDYVMGEIGYDFKSVAYYVNVTSPSSIDTHFDLLFNMMGTLRYDSYENNVLDGWNTYNRVEMDYRHVTDQILKDPAFPYTASHDFWGFGTLNTEQPTLNLELDKQYPAAEIGKKYGKLVLYMYEENPSCERAGEILLDIRRIFDEASIPFYTVDFTLSSPRTEDGQNQERKEIILNDFLYEDIYEDGMTERAESVYEKTKQYYEEQDKIREAEAAQAS